MDDARRISVVLFLHNFPEEYFPGRFNITSARLTCPTTIFGAFTFSGLQPHEENGAGWYPEDFSEESQEQCCNHSDHPAKLDESYDFKRIVAVSYPNNLLAEARFHKFHSALRNEENLDSILPVAGTRLNHQEWLMRTHIKRNLATLDRSTLGAIEMVGMFSWQEGGVPHFPRLEIAQASLTWGGMDNKWWEALNDAYIENNCGKVILLEEGEVLSEKVVKRHARRRLKAQAKPEAKKLCPERKKNGERCKHRYYASLAPNCGHH